MVLYKKTFLNSVFFFLAPMNIHATERLANNQLYYHLHHLIH